MRARVTNGRWVLDDPTGLPEGTEVEIVTRSVASASKASADVYLDQKLREYIHALVVAARSPKYSVATGGASPMDEDELAENAKGCAARANRRYTTPEDIKKVAPEVLRRFVVLSSEVKARNVTLDDVIRAILDETPVP